MSNQRERGGLDLKAVIASERVAAVTSASGFAIALLTGIGLLLVAHQPLFPFDGAVARAAAALAGAVLTGLGAFPLVQLVDRVEKIRLFRKFQKPIGDPEDREPESGKTCALEQLVTEIYGLQSKK